MRSPVSDNNNNNNANGNNSPAGSGNNSPAGSHSSGADSPVWPLETKKLGFFQRNSTLIYAAATALVGGVAHQMGFFNWAAGKLGLTAATAATEAAAGTTAGTTIWGSLTSTLAAYGIGTSPLVLAGAVALSLTAVVAYKKRAAAKPAAGGVEGQDPELAQDAVNTNAADKTAGVDITAGADIAANDTAAAALSAGGNKPPIAPQAGGATLRRHTQRKGELEDMVGPQFVDEAEAAAAAAAAAGRRSPSPK